MLSQISFILKPVFLPLVVVTGVYEERDPCLFMRALVKRET